MSHAFYEGTVYHKRYTPKVHEFRYPFYLLDIDLSLLDTLKNKLFSLGRLNLFSFQSKDHFGQSTIFMDNVHTLLETLGIAPSDTMHFVTLPRVANFVFNPISVLIIFDNITPTHLIAEVHNYNGGRIVYPVPLHSNDGISYKGEAPKDMYVSPFLQTSGIYHFLLRYDKDALLLKIDLLEDGIKKLTASFSGKAKPFKSKTVATLFAKHSFLTFWVVTRTLWQSLKLWRKGLQHYTPTPSDKIRRY